MSWAGGARYALSSGNDGAVVLWDADAPNDEGEGALSVTAHARRRLLVRPFAFIIRFLGRRSYFCDGRRRPDLSLVLDGSDAAAADFRGALV